MRKFKTKRINNKTFIIILAILFFIIFIILSFFELNKSFDNIISIVLDNSFNNGKKLKVIVPTKKLDYLIKEFDFASQ